MNRTKKKNLKLLKILILDFPLGVFINKFYCNLYMFKDITHLKFKSIVGLVSSLRSNQKISREVIFCVKLTYTTIITRELSSLYFIIWYNIFFF
ncbi:hypothetical protein RIR_jg25405.t1 [Rhizophagus irregularis DAOM 181602=DAOM 197198]|nr:hypothetical protein RIR_jg25405.t1 [Rhizophagus irregularis DAOM 181602=DAOM 197198]